MKFKILLFIFLTYAVSVQAAKIAEFDENTNKIKDVKNSQDTNQYINRTDVVINPSIPEGVPQKYQKHSNGAIVEMTQEEKDAVDDAEELASNNMEIARADALEVSTADLAKAIAALTGLTEQQIKDKIKEQKGLN